MKQEVCLKFKLPKEQHTFEIYAMAEDMHEALVDLQKFLFDEERVLPIEAVREFFKERVAGLKL